MWDKLDDFNAGWNIVLDKEHRFLSLIEKLILEDKNEYNRYPTGCEDYLVWLKKENAIVDENVELFSG